MLSDWRSQAACKGVDGNIFVMTNDERCKNRYDEAKKICATCPVDKECLYYALTFTYEQGRCRETLLGCWAGTTLRQRTNLRRLLWQKMRQNPQLDIANLMRTMLLKKN